MCHDICVTMYSPKIFYNVEDHPLKYNISPSFGDEQKLSDMPFLQSTPMKKCI